MRRHQANVVVHLKKTPGSEQLAALQAELARLDGVARAEPSARLSRLMLVDYDPVVTSAQKILRSIEGRGIGAQLIGM